MTTVTRAEVDALKLNWLKDPCYDVADMGSEPGWEPYADELKAFQNEQYALWADTRRKAVRDKAASLGIPDNPTLAAYIMRLEARLDKLERARRADDDFEDWKSSVQDDDNRMFMGSIGF